MSTVKDGGPAFPTDEYWDEKRHGVQYGMTLRDYFAAQVMATLPFCLGDEDNSEPKWTPGNMARRAYEISDAMLKAREQT